MNKNKKPITVIQSEIDYQSELKGTQKSAEIFYSDDKTPKKAKRFNTNQFSAVTSKI